MTEQESKEQGARAFWLAAQGGAQGAGAQTLMTGSETASRWSEREVAGVLALLPAPREEDWVVEPAAGVGRFTVELARRAGRVLASDLVPAYVAQNRARCEGLGLGNVTHAVSDAAALALPEGPVGLVFVKWLGMYLPEAEALAMLERFARALRRGGSLFVQESCDTSVEEDSAAEREPYVGDWLGLSYHAWYRPVGFYRRALGDLAKELGGAVQEWDLRALYDDEDPHGTQRAWLLTLGE